MNSYLQKITGRWSAPDDSNQPAAVILPVVPLVYNAGEQDLVEEHMILPAEPTPAAVIQPRSSVQQPVQQQQQQEIHRIINRDTPAVPSLKPADTQPLPVTNTPAVAQAQQSLSVPQLLVERNRIETIKAYNTKIITPSPQLTMIHNKTGEKAQLTTVEHVQRQLQKIHSPIQKNITAEPVKNLVKPVYPGAINEWGSAVVTAGPANNKKNEPGLSIGKITIEIIKPQPVVKTREPQARPVNRAESSQPAITNHKLSFGLRQL